MRKPILLFSLNDVPFDLVDGDCKNYCPNGGQCCPDDPLDKVLNCVTALDDGFLEALGIDWSLPCDWSASAGRDADDDDNAKRAAEAFKSKEDMEADMGAPAAEGALGTAVAGAKASACGTLSAGRAPALAPTMAQTALGAAAGGMLSASECAGRAPALAPTMAHAALGAVAGGKASACDLSAGRVRELAPTMAGGGFDTCGAPDGFVFKEELPHACSLSTTSTSTASSCISLWSPSQENESPEQVSPFHAWRVPTKRRSRPAVVGKRPWPLAFPAVLAAAGGHGGVKGKFGCSSGHSVKRRKNRICTHCETAETPQWRAGPEGPGTLCNACGIRYNLCGLFSEYRPSTSPFFRSGEFSNRRKKVVKLRVQGEEEDQGHGHP